jgi:hypothetical protein
MNEITEEYVKEFMKKEKFDLLPSHKRLSLCIINRIYKKMIHGILFEPIKVNQKLIIDGHHKYVSSKLAKFIIDITDCHKTSATEVYDWNEVEFSKEEWDTKYKIKYLNELDAKYNNLTIEEITYITK